VERVVLNAFTTNYSVQVRGKDTGRDGRHSYMVKRPPVALIAK